MQTQITEPGVSVMAGIYRQAADRITQLGYQPFEPDNYAGAEPGICLSTALRYAAAAHIEAAITSGDAIETDTDLLTEELETRLVAVMYVIGQLRTRTHITDLSDLIIWWEKNYSSHPPHSGEHGYPSQLEAVALLKTAAAMISAAAAANG